MLCRKCGKESPDNAVFCMNCGEKIAVKSSKNPLAIIIVSAAVIVGLIVAGIILLAGRGTESGTSSKIAVLPPYGSMGSVTLLGVEFDIATTTELEIIDSDVTDDVLEQIAQLTNLTELWLNDKHISDLKPLAGLTNLTKLGLLGNQIGDITPLAGLTNLTVLDLRHNQISDITPLTGLTNLTYLWLNDNQISDSDKEQLKSKLPNCDIVIF